MNLGRDTADILAEWREVERLVDETDDPFERTELLRRSKRLRREFAHRVDDLQDVAAHLAEFTSTKPAEPEGE
jgi:hypothetical protein